MKILSSSEIHKIDAEIIASGVSQHDLIDEVGSQLYRWFSANISKNKKILILVGPGNNGCDGLSLLKFLSENGYYVRFIDMSLGSEKYTSFNHFLKIKIKDFIISSTSNLEDYDLIVDALFGVGLTEAPREAYAALIDKVNGVQKEKISIDIPSGVNSDSGLCYSPFFKADKTLTISTLKLGSHLLPGIGASGEVIVIPVPTIDEYLKTKLAEVVSLEFVESWIETITPIPESHKYNLGKVSVVMSIDFPGASLLGAQAAQSSGAGYVQVYCPAELLHQSQLIYPNFVFIGYNEFTDLQQKLHSDDSRCLIIGSGWKDLESEFKTKKGQVTVIDGGFLTKEILDNHNYDETREWIMTPHYGELKRLVSEDCGDDKLKMIRSVLSRFSGVLVAKGYDSIICQKGEPMRLTTWNAPSLAMAGSGDILCGVIAGLVARGLEPLEASSMAVDIQRAVGVKFSMICTPPLFLGKITETIDLKCKKEHGVKR